MKRLASLVAALGVAAGGMLVTAPAAMADEYTCRGAIGGIVLDNVRVPNGVLCRMRGTVVKGNVKVERGGTLHTTAVRVWGNVQAEGHRDVSMTKSFVNGNIQLKQGGKAYLYGNVTNGDIQLFTNRYGQHYIYGNGVYGNLQCKENYPAPYGGGNRVRGNKEDQCRRL